LIGRKRSRLFLPVPLLMMALAEPSITTVGYGWLLVLLGSLWRLWAAGYLMKNAVLITAGPYAWVRHPLYFGMALVLLGWATLTGWSWLTAGLVLYSALIYGCAMLTEERRLLFLFPDYEAYRQRVPMIVPLGWRNRGEPHGHFDWRTVARNGEWRIMMWNAAVALLLSLRLVV
jgi:protein-S-isoprenylcysteine O-methyltransferase Ste14